MEPCAHTAEYGYDYPCIDCAPSTPEGDKLRSIAISFGPGGKQYWHDGPTNREAVKEIFDNAKRYGNEPPEPVNGYASGGPIV